MTEQNKHSSQPFAWYWYDQHGCLYITGDDRKPDLPADAKPLYATEQNKQSDTPAPSQHMQVAKNAELGPDGKEWAKTEAGYRHVESVNHQAYQGSSPAGGMVWHGHAVREAFVAGAEWQEARGTPKSNLHVATPELAGIELAGVAEQLEQGAGAWIACSGCHELIEGHPTGPWSETLKSYMGGGCRECGGIGAIWDSTDYSQVNDPAPMTKTNARDAEQRSC